MLGYSRAKNIEEDLPKKAKQTARLKCFWTSKTFSSQWVVNVDISYASKRRSMFRSDRKLAARVEIVKAQCSAAIGISEGGLQYMQTSEIINLCIVMLR